MNPLVYSLLYNSPYPPGGQLTWGGPTGLFTLGLTISPVTHLQLRADPGSPLPSLCPGL